jgi:hypothetical protein
MDMPTTTRPSKLSIPAPPGLWKVLAIIAERLPQKQLLWFALIVCFSSLGFVAIACIGVGRVAASKPATALVGFIEQQTIQSPPMPLSIRPKEKPHYVSEALK